MDEYISREEAIKELREVYEKEYPTASGDFDEYASHDVPNILRNMKATDVQPVKHGRWELRCYGDYPYCSNCNNEPKSKEITLFCPNCGARMGDDSE